MFGKEAMGYHGMIHEVWDIGVTSWDMGFHLGYTLQQYRMRGMACMGNSLCSDLQDLGLCRIIIHLHSDTRLSLVEFHNVKNDN